MQGLPQQKRSGDVAFTNRMFISKADRESNQHYVLSTIAHPAERTEQYGNVAGVVSASYCATRVYEPDLFQFPLMWISNE